MGTTKTTEQKMPEFQQKFLEGTVIPFAEDFLATEYTPYEGERVAGMTPLQQQAMGGYGALSMGAPQYQQAGETYSRLSQFQSPTMQAATAGAISAGDAAQMTPAQLAEVERMRSVGAIRAAQAPDQIAVNQLASTDIGQYMSPYEQQVIEAGQADIERQRQMASEKLAAQAEAAGAFGGSRQAVQEGVLAGEALRQAGALSAQQRQAGFEQALQSGRFDIGNVQQARTLASQQQLQAETLGQQAREAAAAREQAARAGNMQAANQFAVQQAQFEQQAAQANMQADNAMRQFNANLAQQAAQAQAAREQAASAATFGGQFDAAGIQAGAASGLAGLGGQQLQSQLAGLGAQMQAGEAARMLDQARLDMPYQDYMAAMNYPLTQFGVLTGTAGAIPSGYGTTTQRTGGLGPLLGAAGSLGQTYAMMTNPLTSVGTLRF